MTLVGIGQHCQSIENDGSSLSLRTNWRDLASAKRAVFYHEMTVLAVSAVGLEKSVENESCEAPFCSCDETLNLWPGREMAFTAAEAESDEVICSMHL